MLVRIHLLAAVQLLAVAVLPSDALDNGKALVPPMGWNGYNAIMQFGGFDCTANGANEYNETTFVTTMDILVDRGLRELGWSLLHVDDCWMSPNRTAAGKLQASPLRFPHGIKWLADQAHARGLQLSIYADSGTKTCRHDPGSAGRETLDADTYAGWGVDGIWLDGCFDGADGWKEHYSAWTRAINATGRAMYTQYSWPSYYNDCSLGRGTGAAEKKELEARCGPSPWEGGYILGSRIWGQKMGSKGTKFAESERGVLFSWKRHSIRTPHLKKNRKNELPLSCFRLKWGFVHRHRAVSTRNQTPRSDSANFVPLEPILCPQILEPSAQRAAARACGSE